MLTVGVVTFSGVLGEQYNEILREEGCLLKILKETELTRNELENLDAVVLLDELQQHMGDVCKVLLSIRKKSNIFVWIMGQVISPTSRLLYLQLGATGNIEQQYGVEEACLRLRNVLNYFSKEELGIIEEKEITSSIHLNRENRSVYIEGKEIPLTLKEFKVIKSLYEQRGKAMGYTELHEAVWGKQKEVVLTRIANVVFHLRKKLDAETVGPTYIYNVRSRGYLLREDVVR